MAQDEGHAWQQIYDGMVADMARTLIWKIEEPRVRCTLEHQWQSERERLFQDFFKRSFTALAKATDSKFHQAARKHPYESGSSPESQQQRRSAGRTSSENVADASPEEAACWSEICDALVAQIASVSGSSFDKATAKADHRRADEQEFLRKEVEKLKVERENLSADLEGLLNTKTALESKTSSLKREAQNAETKAASLRSEIQELEAKLTRAKKAEQQLSTHTTRSPVPSSDSSPVEYSRRQGQGASSMQSVRDQLREIHDRAETANEIGLDSGSRGKYSPQSVGGMNRADTWSAGGWSSPNKTSMVSGGASSPSSPFKTRLTKLQADLKALRAELSSS